jgi:hypothetical protein
MRNLFINPLNRDASLHRLGYQVLLVGILMWLSSIAHAQSVSPVKQSTNGTLEIILDNTVSMSGYCLGAAKSSSVNLRWLLKEIENFRAREYLSIRDSFLYDGELNPVAASASPIYQFISASDSGKDCPRRIKSTNAKGQLKDEDTTRLEDVFVKIASNQQEIGMLVTDFLVFGDDQTKLQTLAKAHFEKLGVNGSAGVLMLRLPFVGNYYFDGSRQPTSRVLLNSSNRPIVLFWWAKNPKLASSFLNQIGASYSGLKGAPVAENKLPESASIQVWPHPRVHPAAKSITEKDILGEENTIFSVKAWRMISKNETVEKKWYAPLIDSVMRRNTAPVSYRFEACAPYSNWKKITDNEFSIPVRIDGRCSDAVSDLINVGNSLPIQLEAQSNPIRQGLECAHVKTISANRFELGVSAASNCQVIVNMGKGAALRDAIRNSPVKRLSIPIDTNLTYSENALKAVRAEISPWASIKEPCLDQAQPEREIGIVCNDRENIDRVFDLKTKVEVFLSAGQRAMELLSKRKDQLHFEIARGE